MRDHSLPLLLLLTFGVGTRGHDGEQHEIRSICGEDAVLRCCASYKPGVQYLSVTWYKVGEAPTHHLTGLVMKKLTHQNGTVKRYKDFVREVELVGDTHSLLLQNVTVQDAGTYRCFLSAPVGHQNQDGKVHLKVYEDPNNESDTVYLILAITLLFVALLMLYVSYICLRNTLTSINGKFSNETWLKKGHHMKNFIFKIESNGAVSKTLPQEFV